MQQHEIRLPLLFNAQSQAFASTARFNLVHGGNDSGKTTLALVTLLISHFGALNGFRTAFVVPTEGDVERVKLALLGCIRPLIVNRPEHMRWDLVNGGSIKFIPREKPDAIYDEFHLVVVDDAHQIDAVHDFHHDVVVNILNRHGRAWYFGKPCGMRGPFAALYAGAGREWEGFQLKAPDNPYADQAAIECDRSTMSLDVFRQERLGEFVDAPIDLTPSQQIIGPDETFRQWCERLSAEGLKVDGYPFRLDDRPAMHFIYDLVPHTVKDAYQRIDIIMKCTQVGFTVMEMLAMIYLGLRFPASKIGMFMPSQMLAAGKSTNRFMAIVRTIPAVRKLMKEGLAESGIAGDGNVLTRNIGESRYHFLWTSGKTATESNPMDVVSFDEVQEMVIADMEKVRERMSASRLKYTLMGSTANLPDGDIHWWFKRGQQFHFHTECPHCLTMQVLDDYFPACVGFDPTAPRVNEREREAGLTGEYRYKCHACDGWIDDTQRGQWIAKNPDAVNRSVHYPQTLSPTISAREMIEAFHNAKDMQNFFNRKLGKPYADPSKIPINMEILAACVEEGRRLGVEWKDRARGTFAGIDQMGQFNVILIAERLASGHMAIIHAEEIYSDDPFARCSELIEKYGVKVCVCETLPNYNDAKRFANRHKGIVFLAGYATIQDDMLRWGDSVPSKAERKSDEEERDRYTVTLDQYKCMQVALKRISEHVTVFADPKGLLQMLSDDGDNGIRGTKELGPILERVFKHFTRTALIVEQDEEEKKFRRKVVKVGIDPHFSYAFMLLNVAWARAHGTTGFLFPDAYEENTAVQIGEGQANSHLLNKVLREREEITEDRCKACAMFDYERNFCNELQAVVMPDAHACVMFEQV
ncbi:phage terminase large subunit family protein [Paraburkholderia sediminicola]|uniref:phage terminase large subunit family protein n=1 Tax=Paraburkholderia sediminicola TaxID=458836 RepID=UPI0038B9076F